jgi:hypothetical protein
VEGIDIPAVPCLSQYQRSKYVAGTVEQLDAAGTPCNPGLSVRPWCPMRTRCDAQQARSADTWFSRPRSALTQQLTCEQCLSRDLTAPSGSHRPMLRQPSDCQCGQICAAVCSTGCELRLECCLAQEPYAYPGVHYT